MFLEYQLPEPEFKQLQDGFWVRATTGKVSEGLNEGGKVVDKVVDNLTENQQEILKLVKNDKYVSARGISTKIGISSRKTQENIKKLKEKGLLERIGPAKGGYWKIKEPSKQ